MYSKTSPSLIKIREFLEISVNNNELHIGCSDGCLKLAEIQLEGKKRMSAEEFIKGARFTNNQCL